MFSAEDATRRSTLKTLGGIQIFLGISAFCGAISSVSMAGRYSTDKTYSGFWASLFYVFLGLLSVVGACFVEGPPPRAILLACVILNSIVAVLSAIVGIIFITALTAIDVSSLGLSDMSSPDCYSIALALTKAIFAEAVIRAILIIPVCIMAGTLAGRLRNACCVTTTHHVTHGAPAQPYVASVTPGYPAGSGPYPGHPA